MINSRQQNSMANKISINKYIILIFCILLQKTLQIKANLQNDNRVEEEDIVWVNKCCEKFEIRIDSVCSQVNESGKLNTKIIKNIRYKNEKVV